MKRIALLAIVVAGLAALAVAALPKLISTDLIKRRIADQLSDWTGRAVALNGEASLSIYPHMAISIGEVVIANPEGMGEEPFIAADSLTTRFRLLPLLLGRTAFHQFELIKPRIHVVVNEKGQANWSLGDGSVVGGGDGGPGSTGSAAEVGPDIKLGHLTVNDGTIVFDNLVSGRHEEMTALTLDATWPSTAAPLSGAGTLQWRGETIEFNGSATTPLELAAGRPSPVRFALASTPLRIAFSGDLVSLDVNRLTGEATVTTPSMRRTIEMLGTAMGPGVIFGAASIKGNVDWAGSTVSFANATLELDGNSAEGALAADFAGDRPNVRGTLAFDTLDLSPYLEASRADLAVEGPWLIAPTRLPIANAIDADLRVSAGQVLFGATRVGAAAMAATIKDGRVAIDIGEAQVWGGTLTARISTAMTGETLSASASVRLADVPTEAGLTDLAGIAVLDGTGAASVDIVGQGRNWGELAQATTGTVKLEVVDGSLSGLDVDAIAAMVSDPLARPMTAGTGSIDFARLAGTLAIGGGGVETHDLVMAGNAFDIAVTGWASVLSGVIDAKATLTRVDAQGLASEVPLTLTGAWRAPLIQLDHDRLKRAKEEANPVGGDPTTQPPQ